MGGKEENMSSISNYMLEVLNNYNNMRGKTPESSVFWDAIIISASDASQEVGYKLLISQKQDIKEIPLSVPFHVFADPPGYKIGCGGSTMYVLEKVFKIYGTAMYNMRFLLIPAGGYSQRLPNLSIVGKLFSPLPFGRSRYQMLDLILACYVPFLKRMPPGVLLVSSDAIISYSLSNSDSWTFENEGFTALAHPSPVAIGTSHGVYVLPKNENMTDNSSTFMSECIRVLQKPTVQEMIDKGAIVKSHSSGSKEENEIIFSDSAFFFDHKISKKLVAFYNTHKPLKCELSSYGDFLQPLGACASRSYIMDKLTKETLAEVRSALYAELFETKLSILVLKNSNFHHLGVMREYLESLCFENKFSEAFPVSRYSTSTSCRIRIVPLFIDGTVVHSIFHPVSTIPKSSIVEYSDLRIVLNVGKNCIISNVQLPGHSVQRILHKIPDNTLLHSVILKEGYVTIAFNVNDDIKKSYENVPEMRFFGNKLRNFLKQEDFVFSGESDEVSLWNAKLFPVCSSPEESFERTLEIVLCLTEGVNGSSNFTLERKDVQWVSMKDILLLKDTHKTMHYLNSLHSNILGIFSEIDRYLSREKSNYDSIMNAS